MIKRVAPECDKTEGCSSTRRVAVERTDYEDLAHPRLNWGYMRINGWCLLGELRVSFTTRSTFRATTAGAGQTGRSTRRRRGTYPDVVMHVTTLWLLSPFNEENGGTFIVPGSHRANNNPSGDNGIAPARPFPTEMQVTGAGRERAGVR